ncbi:SDR family NAD(P)-dependent oxidoreductase [Halobacteriales archaeon Cl-PHB]
MHGQYLSSEAYSDRTIVVTGAARGIGAACAETFAEAGGTVVGADVRDMSETAAAVAETHGEFVPVETDVTDPDAVADLLAVARDHGPADVIVNVAGIVTKGRVDDIAVEDWREALDVNLSGPFLVVREGIDQLRETGGNVVNVSSIYGQVGTGERTPYVASKAGVDGLTRALAAELGPEGVRANAVAPGFIRTPMTEPYLDDETADRYEGLAALDRLGEPEEVADAVAYLASDGARYVTGETLLVDGGRGTTE